MQKREMETKNKNNCCFAQALYSLTKLCNIFDEAFFVDVSIEDVTANVMGTGRGTTEVTSIAL